VKKIYEVDILPYQIDPCIISLMTEPEPLVGQHITKKASVTDESFNPDDIARVKEEAASEVKSILLKLKDDYPGVMEGVGIALGATSGGAMSFAALWGLGTVGLSGAGITSGLATAGAVVGGGMVAGVGVLAAPIAVLALGGYWLMNRSKKAKLAAALGVAIGKLYNVQARLIRNAEYFVEEIAGIKVMIEHLTDKKSEV
jgi:hypothetical protein